METVVLAPGEDVHFAMFGGELEGVGEEVVHDFDHVVGHEVHFDFASGDELQVDVAAAGKAAVALHDHGDISHDVAVAPVRVADG